MIKSGLLKYAYKDGMPRLLVLITVCSWFFFPLMAKLLYPTAFNIGFVISFLLISAVTVIAFTRNQIALQTPHKVMLVCWIGYIFVLLLATIKSNSMYSLTQWSILYAKFLFFVFLFLYINLKYIITTLRIYANLMVGSVVLALVAIFTVVMGAHPLATVDFTGKIGDVFFGVYYVQNTPICMPTPVFRIQGLSEEPGTYAFALLPAFFWLLIAEKAYVRSLVIVIGIMLSMSLGVGILLLALSPVMVWKYHANYKIPGVFLGAVCSVLFMYSLSDYCTDSYFKHSSDKLTKVTIASLSTSSSGKVHSFQDRLDGLSAVFNYLKAHPMGAGTALGMNAVNNSISVGYAVAAAEAGVVGGTLYLCFFVIMGWLAMKAIVNTNIDSFEGQIKIVVALSVCAALVMGAQRIQPDLSLWHMWFYAMWFYLLQINLFSEENHKA